MAAIMRKLKRKLSHVASSAVPAVDGDRDDHEDFSTELEYSFAIEYRGPPLAYDIPDAVPVDLDQIATAAPVSSASLLHNLSLPVIQPIAKSNPSNKRNGEKGVSTLSDKLGRSGKLGFSCRLSGSLEDVLELPDDGQEAQGFQSYMSPGNWGSSESGSSSRSLSSEVFSGREEAGGDETPHHFKRPSTVTFCDPDSNDIVQEEEFELSDGEESVQVRPRVERNGNKGLCFRCGKGNRLTDKEVCIVCGAKYCFNCVLRAMGSMPEGRKCVTCIGFGIDESRRKMLGKCSRMLKWLLTKLEVELIMKAEISCQPNQLPGNLIFVNDEPLSQEELVRLQGCRNPPKKLKPGCYWYDNVSGFWGKEGHNPCQIISPQLNVGGHIKPDASKGDTNILMNGREITKLEAFILQLAGVPCEGNLHYWVNADESYQEQGMNKVKGKIWDKTSIKLVYNVLSLPIPSGCANVSADEVNTQNSVEEKMPSKLVLVGCHKSGTSTIFKQEGHNPCQIISPQLNVGGHIKPDASKGDINILINGREITKLEAFILQLAGVPCEGNLHYWVNADGSYQEEGMDKVKGNIWDKTSIKLVCNVLSLPIPSGCENVSADEVNTQNSVEEKMPSKLVLVGCHKSGTSTIFKQAKLLYNVPFSEDEGQNIKFMIQRRLYSYLCMLHEGCEWFEAECLLEKSEGKGQLLDEPGPSGNASQLTNKTKYSIGPRLKALADWLIKAMVSGNLEAIFPAATREYAPFVEELWKDPAIQATYDRGNEIEMLPRPATYFLNRAVEISRPDYELSDIDILYAEGITSSNSLASMEFSFPMSPGNSNLDPAYQCDRSLRYQLIRVHHSSLGGNCELVEMFEDVDMVLFCVALTDYDEFSVDGVSMNKMMASKQLFENIVTHPALYYKDFLLILNKFDLLEEKINEVPLSRCEWFHDFNPVTSQHTNGPPLAHRAFQYVAMKFKRLFRSLTDRKLFVSLVTALEPDTIDEALRYAHEIQNWDE